jgi:hypothetical protein
MTARLGLQSSSTRPNHVRVTLRVADQRHEEMDELEQTSAPPPFLHANTVVDARPTLIWGLLLLVKKRLVLVAKMGSLVCEQPSSRRTHQVRAMDGIASTIGVV